jgi:hypothetical protein
VYFDAVDVAPVDHTKLGALLNFHNAFDTHHMSDRLAFASMSHGLHNVFHRFAEKVDKKEVRPEQQRYHANQHKVVLAVKTADQTHFDKPVNMGRDLAQLTDKTDKKLKEIRVLRDLFCRR